MALQAKTYDIKNNWDCICITHQNILYAGGKNTLQYFENNFTQPITLPKEMHISALLEYNSHLLIGTKKGDVYIYDIALKTFQYLGSMHAEISNIHMHDQGIYMTTLGNGFGVYTLNKWTQYNTDHQLQNNYIYQIASDKNGRMIGCSDKGLFYMQNKTISYPPLNQQLNDIIITAIDIDQDDIYMGTQQGQFTQTHFKHNADQLLIDTLFPYQTINDLLVLDQFIVIATDKGAFKINKLQPHDVDTFVSHTKITDLALDQTGALWLCGEKYLASFYFDFFTLLTHHTRSVHTLTAEGDSLLWFTPDVGLSLMHIQSKKILKNIKICASNQTDITSLYLDTKHQLWIGTSGEGIYRYDTKSQNLKHITIDQRFETAQILSITGNEDEILVATLNGVWVSSLTDSLSNFYSLEAKLNLHKYYVFHVLIDHLKNTWLATDGHGILKISDNKLTRFSQQHHIPAKVFYSIIEDAKGQMWMNAYMDGIYCVNNDSTYHLDKNAGLQSNEIMGLYNFSPQAVIAISNIGIDVIEIEQMHVSQIPFNNNPLQVNPELNSITHTSKAIYIGTDSGIVQFKIPSYWKPSTIKTSINTLEVLDRPITKKTKVFKHFENYIKFGVSTSHTFEENIYVRYKLEGLNDLWVNTLNHEIVFPRLNPGNYVFKIQSANNSQFIHPYEESYSFTITPPFWKQWWFIALLSIVSIILMYKYIKYREQKVTRVQLLEKDKAIAEFNVLKAQINPHFLFNSFNTLMQVIEENQEMAIEYTQHLSDFYRSLIAYKEQDLVPLEKEIDLLNNYFYLQKMRFGHSLLFDNQLNHESLKNWLIPPLTLQMLAENAIKHNVISDNKHLTISLFADKSHLSFQNNINKKITQEAGEQLGLQNIKNRYKQYTNEEVLVRQANDFFIVQLPKITE